MKTFAGILAGFVSVATGTVEAQIPSENCYQPRSSFKRETEVGGLGFEPCLRAKPEHPIVVLRGESIEFDGSASTGKIKKRKWTLAPKDCPDGPGEWTTNKEKFTAQILCPMTVTLEVSDGKNTDSRKTTVTVTARRWKTETRRARTQKSMSFVSNSMEFGKNRCQDTNHFDDDPGDHIHFADGSPITWRDEAYWPAQVEGDGPFKGYWYLGRAKVQVMRNEFINSRLVDDTSTVYRHNAGNGKLNDLRLVAQAVRMHEQTHSDLMMEALKSVRDPAVQIEPLLHRDFDELQKKADVVIGSVNSKMAEATGEAKVKAKLGRIDKFARGACIFTADLVKKCFYPVANIGDEP